MPSQPHQKDDRQNQEEQRMSEKQPSEKGARKREKERVQLDFSPEALERLDELKKMTGAGTRAEVMRQALRVYEWFVSETDPNDVITVTDSKGEIMSTFKAKLLYLATKS